MIHIDLRKSKDIFTLFEELVGVYLSMWIGRQIDIFVREKIITLKIT